MTATLESVGSASRAQWRAVAGTLARTFQDDPVFSWIVPDAERRARAGATHFSIECRDTALRFGRSLLIAGEDGSAAATAVVLPPGEWQMPARVQVLRGPEYTWAFGPRLPWAIALGLRVEARHPREPHVYLAYIGVLPEAQGRGLGGALLTRIADQCDHDGHPAYLEASSPRNARLYRRFGFETLETIRPFGAPPIELMWREPR